MADFKLVSAYQPQGDQPAAIAQLTENLQTGTKYNTLLGVTGSGKTFTMANVIANIGKPTLLMSHNKTLAAQLYGELREFFPHNAVEYFVSYYDYYQPEAYIPSTDTYIEKDSSINDEIDRLRLKATSSLLSRNDVIVVSSVSCIYGIGSRDDYARMSVRLAKGESIDRDELLHRLVDIHYTRNDIDFARGTFRVRGDIVEIIPAYEEEALRISFWGDEVERIDHVNPLTGEILRSSNQIDVRPAKHFVTTASAMKEAIYSIETELALRLAEMRENGNALEAHRLESRTRYDIEMMIEIGYCSGIENYSRYLSQREPGSTPQTLIDFFPDDFLLVMDESHMTIPQVRGMYAGDRSRKKTLVEHGFRLPSALDNRPLFFDEFEQKIKTVVFMSATPADYELEKSEGMIIEQIIRPTGLVDPKIIIRPVSNQVDDLLGEIRIRAAKKERILVTTLTKRMSEDLTDYLEQMGVRVRYLHSEIAALDRIDIIRDLRLHEFDVLVGVNLLREGLDLPEVSLVAIMDADKEGFLRSDKALIQIAGRAARNLAGLVIFYADKITGSIARCTSETSRRRKIQLAYNAEHNITPASIKKTREQIIRATSLSAGSTDNVQEPDLGTHILLDEIESLETLQKEMLKASDRLEFEKAAKLRDKIETIKKKRKRAASKRGRRK